MYNLEEQMRNVSERIHAFQEKNINPKDFLAMQADEDWGASFFFGKLLFNSNPLPNTNVTEEELVYLHKDYEKSYGQVNLNELITKSWVRLVGGMVEIPNAIRNAIRRFNDIADIEKEFYFFLETKKVFHNNSVIEKNAFNDFWQSYQLENQVEISLENSVKFFFFEEKERIRINNIDQDKFLFDFKIELKFIGSLLDIKSTGDQYQLVIDCRSIELICSEHKNYFPNTPTLELLTEQKVFIKKDDTILINLWNCNPNYWESLNDKIGIVVWNYLKDEHKQCNLSMVKNWVLKMRSINRMNTCLPLVDTKELKNILQIFTDLVLEEKDLYPKGKEIEKLLLSNRDVEYIFLSNIQRVQFPNLHTITDLLSLYESLEKFDDFHLNDVMWSQDIRWYIDDLIQILVFNDQGQEFEKIKILLKAGSSRPYLLWKACFLIHHRKPEIIPYLIIDLELAPLAFQLYYQSSLNKSFAEIELKHIRENVFAEMFGLLLSAAKTADHISISVKAQVIFQTIFLFARYQWNYFQTKDSIKVKENPTNFQHVLTTIFSLLQNEPLETVYFNSKSQDARYFFPYLLKEIFLNITGLTEQKFFPAGVFGLSTVKWDLFFKIFQLVQTKTYKNQIDELSEHLSEIEVLAAFVEDYEKLMGVLTIRQWDYESGELKDVIPFWSNDKNSIQELSWDDIIIGLQSHNLLHKLLHPVNLRLQITEDKFDKQNQFVISKIRQHIEILLISYNAVKDNEFKFLHKELPVDLAISNIELAIVSLVSQYSINSLSVGKTDVFADRYERDVFGNRTRPLLAFLAQTLPRFTLSNRQTILFSVITEDKFTKCLKLLEFLSSDADIVFIQNQIKTLDVQDYLSEKKYIPEMEIVLEKLAQSEEFVQKAKEALSYWNEKVIANRNNKEYAMTAFRIKMLIAYYETDEQTIQNETNPDTQFLGLKRRDENVTEIRQFYLGLLKTKENNPQAAYHIFNELFEIAENNKAVIALNRLYAHIRISDQADSLSNKYIILKKALQEWDEYEKSILENDRSSTLGFLYESIWLNKLYAYNELQVFSEFEKIFVSLDVSYQLKKDFFELRVKNLLERDFFEAARSFINEGQKFHQSTNGALPDFIKKARELIENKEDYKRLAVEYLNIVTRTPEKLVLILPENIRGTGDFSEYILKEICLSGNEILDIVNSVSHIANEDKYSDLLILNLQSKFRNWYWSVGNTRGGFSDSNKRNPGELDFIIRGADNERIATCEALIIKGINTNSVTRHVLKSFNYDHRRNLSFIIVYYQGKNFMKHLKDYEARILPNIKYPENFALAEKVIEKDYNFTNDSIKVVLAKHGNNTRVFHVFININYKA